MRKGSHRREHCGSESITHLIVVVVINDELLGESGGQTGCSHHHIVLCEFAHGNSDALT